jgi:hypothetical protein
MMDEYILLSSAWILVCAVYVYFSDKRAYKEGMLDAIVQHNSGILTYSTWIDDDGEMIIEIKVGDDED